MVDGAGGLDQLFGPGNWLIALDAKAEQPRIYSNGGSHIEVTVVGGPAEAGPQIGELGIKRVIGLSLSGAVPEGQHICFATGKVAGMRVTHCGCITTGSELVLGEPADGLQHRI